MPLPVLLFALAAIVLTILATRFALAHTHRHHEPIEFYMGWGGYWHPIGLGHRISPEKAVEVAAAGAVYLIGHYDDKGRLTRVVKMSQGKVFFEYAYSYHPNGGVKTARVSRGGRVTLLEYDARGRGKPGQRSAF